MGYRGTKWSKTQYHRRKKKAAALGCAIEDVPDTRGKHNNYRRGPDSPLWNDDAKIISDHGYVKIRVGPGHPLADPNGYAYEHLVVWCSAGNRRPSGDQVLHHINENKTDNRLLNLKIVSRSEHGILHHSRTPDETVRQIRERYASGQADMPALAKEFGLPITRISKFIRGEVRQEAGRGLLGGIHVTARAGRLFRIAACRQHELDEAHTTDGRKPGGGRRFAAVVGVFEGVVRGPQRAELDAAKPGHLGALDGGVAGDDGCTIGAVAGDDATKSAHG